MRTFVFLSALFCAGQANAQQISLSGRPSQGGSVNVTQTAVPGTTSSVNTLNTTVQVQGPYQGSARSGQPFSGTLPLREAVARGLEYNLGTVGVNAAMRQADGQTRVARSVLLPNLNGGLRETVQQSNLRALGLRISSPFPGAAIPSIVGPFNYFDLRATLTQKLADMNALSNYRSAKEVARANMFNAQDARDLVVLAVGGAYLQVIASQARVASARVQLATANALYQQTFDRKQSGLVAQIDVNRSQVQRQTQQQRLSTLENDLAKQKINLARLTGLPPNPDYAVSDDVPFAAPPLLTPDEAIARALATRADLKAASAQVSSATHLRSAARAERLPALDVSADYGVIGTNPSQAHGTFTVTGSLRFPIWQGGRTEGDIAQAEAALYQRRAELQDIRGKIESDVRSALLDMDAAASQVELSKNNQALARQTVDLSRQRLDAGITDTVELVQAQEAVATADLDYITSLFAHNLAKLSLARALGQAAENLDQFLKLR